MPKVRIYWRSKGRQSSTWFPGAKAWLDVHDEDGRKRVPAYTSDPAKAEEQAEALRARQAQGRPAIAPEARTVADALDAYEREGMRDLSVTTRRQRSYHLAAMRDAVGALPLAELDRGALGSWWRSAGAGTPHMRRNRLDALSQALWLALDLGWVDRNAARDFLAERRSRGRGKYARAATDPVRSIVALERPEHVLALLLAADATLSQRRVVSGGPRRRAYVRGMGRPERHAAEIDRLALIVALDTGLRLGELRGMRWHQVADGIQRRADDVHRVLVVDRCWPIHADPDEPPKSGRVRNVPMSRRVQAELRAHWMRRGRPAEGFVLDGLDPASWRSRLKALCTRAKVPTMRPKDLRSTFASHLLSLGVPVSYLARVLGHTSTALTEQRYARWLPDGYREPERLQPGEVVTDLMARVAVVPCADTMRHNLGTPDGETNASLGGYTGGG